MGPGRRLDALGAVERAKVLLQEHLGATKPARELKPRRTDPEVDAIARIGGHVFAFEVRSEGTASSVMRAGAHLLPATWSDASWIPLLVVSTMTPAGRRACRHLGLDWIDLAGNAEIAAKGLRISISDRRTTRPRGRPTSIFTARRSRVIRHLLMFSEVAWKQRELALQTGLSEGDTSRVVRHLEAEQMVVREPSGAVRPANPAALLADWYQAYAFNRHSIVRGHVQARSGEQLTRSVSGWLSDHAIPHAATGLAGAWLWTHFAAFRVSTFLVDRSLTEVEERDLGIFRDEAGANLWLVVPEDRSVFTGAGVQDFLPCAHPLQIYLDLKAHPERAAEAAERLQAAYLKWS